MEISVNSATATWSRLGKCNPASVFNFLHQQVAVPAARMGTSAAPVVYAHDPSTLLPLLTPLLPSSIVLVGAILSNPSTSSDSSTPLRDVFATFPPSTEPPEEWMVVAILPGASNQMRLFHSLEATPSPSPDAIARGQELVNTVVAHVLKQYPTHRLGAVNTLWAESLRLNVVGGPHRTVCTTFLSPAAGAAIDSAGADMEGLMLDVGRPGDEVLVSQPSGACDGNED